VLSAARIYGAIGRKVRARGADAWASRTYVPRGEKALYGVRALLSAVINREKMPAGGIDWGIADYRPKSAQPSPRT
jgi:phytoene synthase